MKQLEISRFWSGVSCSLWLLASVSLFTGCTSGASTANPQAVPDSPEVTFTISPATIVAGASSTLAWSSANASGCAASGAWSGSLQTSGSQSVSQSTPGTYSYTVTCTGAGGSASSTNTLTVSSPSGSAGPSIQISLTPSSVTAGQSSNLAWSTSADATNCSASGAWSGTISTSGSQAVSQSASGSYSYTLTCSGPGGSSAASATLTVTPAPPSIAISVTPSTVATNHTATLAWSASNSTSCDASGAWGGVRSLNGALSVSQSSTGDYTYTLSCTNGSTSVSNSATLTVVTPEQLTTTLTSNPSSVAVGDSTTLTWSSSGAHSCTASGAWSGNLAASGSRSVVVNYQGNNSYYITCSSPTGTGSASTTVQGLVASVSLSASPTTVGTGMPTTLTWSSTQATSCTATGEWSGTLAASGSQAVTPNTTGPHTYELTCGNPGAPTKASITVSAVTPTSQLSAFPKNVMVGQDFALTWSSSYAQSCSASGSWSSAIGTSGQQTYTASAPATKQYTITCTNAGGSDTHTVNVTVAAAPAQPAATTFQMGVDHAGSTTFNGTITYPATPTWSVTFPSAVSYPVIADGRVFVTVRNTSSYGTQLYALNEATGAVLWGPVAISGTYFWSSPTYENGKVFVQQYDGILRAFDAATGNPAWSTDLPGQYSFSAPPNAYGGIVFTGGAGSGGTVYAVDEASGSVLWTQGVANGDKSSPSLTPTGMYVSYPCQTYDFAPDTGAAVWHNQNGCSGGGGRTSPVKNNVLFARYFDGFSNSIHEFNAKTGAEVGLLSSDTSPAITATQAFTMNSGTLQSITLSSGNAGWTFAGDGALVTAPIVINNRVIVGSSSGNIYAVDAATGAQTWVGLAGSGMAAPDEQNVSAPTSGLAAGEGYLIAPAGSKLTAWKLVP